MVFRLCVSILSCVALLLVLVPLAAADEAAEGGRALLDKHKLAVVTVKLVIKQRFSAMGDSQEEDSQSEATGTVIDPSGLTVLSLTATDPSSVFRNMMGGEDEEGGFKFESRVTDAKILTDDGKEIPAKIVLRDKDLDLAFIRPKEAPAQPMACVDLAAPGEPKLLDQVVFLNRLGKVASRAYAASVERVECVVTKPRTLYIPGQGMSAGGLGSPAFLLDGKIVGIAVMRSIKSEGGGGALGMMSGALGGGGSMPKAVVLPASDVKEAAAQAPQANEVPDEEPLPEPAKEDAQEPAQEGAAPEGAGQQAPDNSISIPVQGAEAPAK